MYSKKQYNAELHVLRLIDETIFVPDHTNFRETNRVRDITDGSAYRRLHEESRKRVNAPSQSKLVTLILNTDGLQLNESGNRSVWPLFGVVAEISPHRRYQNDKILNLALWEGDGKPPIEAIMKNLQMEIDEINQQGKNFMQNTSSLNYSHLVANQCSVCEVLPLNQANFVLYQRVPDQGDTQ